MQLLLFFNSMSNLKPSSVGPKFVILVLKSLMLEPSTVLEVVCLVFAGSVAVVSSSVVVVSSSVVVVASVVVSSVVVVVVASVVSEVVAAVVVAAVVAAVVVSSTVVVTSVSSLEGSIAAVVVASVVIVSTGFLPKRFLRSEVLFKTKRTPIATRIIARNVIRPASPGSFVALGYFFFFFVLTVLTGVIVLLLCELAVALLATPLVACTGCLPLGSNGELSAAWGAAAGLLVVPGLCPVVAGAGAGAGADAGAGLAWKGEGAGAGAGAGAGLA